MSAPGPSTLCFLGLCALAACAPATDSGGADVDAAGSGDVGSDAAGPPDCAAWSPYADVDPATAPPCEAGVDTWRACTAGAVTGLARCVYVTTGEDTGVHVWGPCAEACAANQVGTRRACAVGGVAGVEHCDAALGLDAYAWQGCQPEACVVCTPGDEKLCGPGTNYPDTLMRCELSSGQPYWFDGDCIT